MKYAASEKVDFLGGIPPHGVWSEAFRPNNRGSLRGMRRRRHGMQTARRFLNLCNRQGAEGRAWWLGLPKHSKPWQWSPCRALLRQGNVRMGDVDRCMTGLRLPLPSPASKPREGQLIHYRYTFASNRPSFLEALAEGTRCPRESDGHRHLPTSQLSLFKDMHARLEPGLVRRMTKGIPLVAGRPPENVLAVSGGKKRKRRKVPALARAKAKPMVRVRFRSRETSARPKVNAGAKKRSGPAASSSSSSPSSSVAPPNRRSPTTEHKRAIGEGSRRRREK